MQPDNDQISEIVQQIMVVREVTWGTTAQEFYVRFRGELSKDSAIAYDELEDGVRPLGFTPLFRIEDDTHTVLLIKGVIDPKPSNPRTNLILFLITLVSVMFAGTLYGYDGPVGDGQLGLIIAIFKNIGDGIPFALSMLAILLAHEFGHYLAARYHKTAVTLPYFIPFPLSPFGTMGAFIQLKAPPKNKRILHDIGIAGPLAGFIVTIPILLYGLWLSEVNTLPTALLDGQGLSLEGNSLFYLVAKFLVHGEWLPTPASFNGQNPLFYWIGYFFTGLPTPLGGRDVMLHPVAWAGWAGLLVTGLNLIPVGQLDGGHLIYVLFGKDAKKLMPVVLVTLGLLGFAWQGWWLWAVFIYMFGRQHAEPLDQITPLDRPRFWMALLGLIIFFFIFTPVPLRAVFGP